VNVSDPDTKTFKKTKIISVEGNQANPHYVRRNIITKGAVVKTEMGSVRITSRPGQTGFLNGVLLEEKKPA
jgi:small subunit ribosomal protein S8e